MSYSEKLTYYRAEFKKYLEAHDAENAKLYAILYAKLVREIGSKIESYVDRATLSAEGEKYDLFAAMIAKYGITADVKKTILGRDANSFSSNNPPSASVSTAGATFGDNADWGAKIFEKYLPATLVVRTSLGIGTGFFITSDGYFITNHHVVYEGSKLSAHINVKSGDGKINCEAEFIKADKELDVALLKIKNHPEKTPFVPLIKDYSLVRPGIAMILIGNGLNFGLAPIEGNVKYTRAKYDGDLVYTAPSNNGDSGAPVFNKNGECIGIHKSSTVECGMGKEHVRVVGLSNATPAQSIRELLSEWGLEDKV